MFQRQLCWKQRFGGAGKCATVIPGLMGLLVGFWPTEDHSFAANCPTDPYPCTPVRRIDLDYQKVNRVECNNCGGGAQCSQEQCASFTYEQKHVRCCRTDLTPPQCVEDLTTGTQQNCATVNASPGTWLWYEWRYNVQVSACSLAACSCGNTPACARGVRTENPVLQSQTPGSTPCS